MKNMMAYDAAEGEAYMKGIEFARLTARVSGQLSRLFVILA